MPRPTALGLRGGLYFVLVALGLAANLVAWRWEIPGASAALVALAGLMVIELALNRTLPGMWFFILLGSPALLFLLAQALGRGQSPASSP